MAFPEDPLGTQVELQIGGVWTDITADAQLSDIITHTRGRQNQGVRADPASCSLTLKSDAGKYSPRNPRSPYYGLIGRNSPVRVSVHTDPRLLVSGNTGSRATTPDTAALDITGDIDIRVDAQLSNWGAGVVEIAAKQELVGDQRSWRLVQLAAGELEFVWTTAGTAASAVTVDSTVPLPVTSDKRIAVRVTLGVNNGAGGWTVTFYTAETLAGPWTQLGAAVTGSGVTSIFNSTSPLEVGDVVGMGLTRPVGAYHGLEVRNGINGTVVANPDFTAQTVGVTSFSDSAGRVWTLQGDAAITDKYILFSGEYSDWPPSWSPRGDLIKVSGQGSGILRRLGQGVKPFDSTLRRRIPSGNPIAYWPMEDAREATQAYSPVPGVRPMRLTNFDFASDETLTGSSALPVLQVGGTLSATVPAPVSGTGPWHVELVNFIPVAPVANTVLYEIVCSGTGTRYRVRVATNNVQLQVVDADDNQLLLTSTTAGTAPPFFASWNRVRVFARQNGANVDVDLGWLNTANDVGHFQTGSFAGTVGRVTQIRSIFGAGLEGTAIGHLAVFQATNINIYSGADDGYNGETAAARVLRLGSEESLSVTVAGTQADTMQMGPQRPDTFLDLLAQCEDADGGMLVEAREQLGLRYRTRTSLYNQTPALTLTYGAPGLAPPLEPVDDDEGLRNDRSVTRTGGSTARAVLEDGSLSVQPPPNGVGVYDDSVELNLYSDAQTGPVAGWRLHLGTWDEARYETVRVRLHKAPSMIPAVLALNEGDLIRITDLPSWLPPGPVDLIVQGYTERIGIYTWEIDFVCTPAGPWSVAVYDTDRRDASGSALAAAAGATDGTLTVVTGQGPLWTSDVEDMPFDVTVGGELVTAIAPSTLINDNAFFATDTGAWTGQNASISRSTTVVPPDPRAVASLRIVPNGSSAEGGAICSLTPAGSITPGASYVLSGWLYSVTGSTDIQMCVDWADAAGGYLSTGFSGAGFTVAAGEWKYTEQTFTAPASASRASVRARHDGTPAASAIWHVWAARITRTTASFLRDAFGRTASSSWGTSDSGTAWNTVGGGPATDYSVGSGYGVQVLSTVDTSRRTAVTAVHPDFDVYGDITTSALATGDSLFGAITGRMLDASNMYMARLEFTTTNTILFQVRKMVGGVQTQIGSTYTVPVTHVAGTFIRVRFQAQGDLLQAKAWRASDPEPHRWHISATDTAITAANQIGTRSIRLTGNTNSAAVEVRYDNIDVINPQVFSVTRSQNGIVKAQSAGSAVSLAKPAIRAL